MILLSFKQWLIEVGMGGGGPGSGMAPPKQNPTQVAQGAFATYHSPKERDPKNPEGSLPPVKKRMKKKMKNKSKAK